jgi:hypothetical protein
MGVSSLAKQKIKCRNLVPEDYEAVCELQLTCFPGMKP